MKYKAIRSMAHNWSHSFMSGMNYVDGDHVCYDMRRLAEDQPGKKVVISWIPVRPEELDALTPRVRKSIGFYRDGLDKHMSSHGIDHTALLELRTEVRATADGRAQVLAYALDDRGKEHVIDVQA